MSVPKCKDCKSYKTESIRDYSDAVERWCHFTNHRISKSGVTYSEGMGVGLYPKFITGNEARTSPKWCPLREIQKEGEK